MSSLTDLVQDFVSAGELSKSKVTAIGTRNAAGDVTDLGRLHSTAEEDPEADPCGVSIYSVEEEWKRVMAPAIEEHGDKVTQCGTEVEQVVTNLKEKIDECIQTGKTEDTDEKEANLKALREAQKVAVDAKRKALELIQGSPGVPPAAINTVLKSNFELNRSGTEDLMAEEKIEKMSDQEKQEWFDKTREQKILNREQGAKEAADELQKEDPEAMQLEIIHQERKVVDILEKKKQVALEHRETARVLKQGKQKCHDELMKRKSDCENYREEVHMEKLKKCEEVATIWEEFKKKLKELTDKEVEDDGLYLLLESLEESSKTSQEDLEKSVQAYIVAHNRFDEVSQQVEKAKTETIQMIEVGEKELLPQSGPALKEKLTNLAMARKLYDLASSNVSEHLAYLEKEREIAETEMAKLASKQKKTVKDQRKVSEQTEQVQNLQKKILERSENLRVLQQCSADAQKKCDVFRGFVQHNADFFADIDAFAQDEAEKVYGSWDLWVHESDTPEASSPVAAGSGASTTALQQRSVLEKLQEEMTKRLKATLDEVRADQRKILETKEEQIEALEARNEALERTNADFLQRLQDLEAAFRQDPTRLGQDSDSGSLAGFDLINPLMENLDGQRDQTEEAV